MRTGGTFSLFSTGEGGGSSNGTSSGRNTAPPLVAEQLWECVGGEPDNLTQKTARRGKKKRTIKSRLHGSGKADYADEFVWGLGARCKGKKNLQV